MVAITCCIKELTLEPATLSPSYAVNFALNDCISCSLKFVLSVTFLTLFTTINPNDIITIASRIAPAIISALEAFSIFYFSFQNYFSIVILLTKALLYVSVTLYVDPVAIPVISSGLALSCVPYLKVTCLSLLLALEEIAV